MICGQCGKNIWAGEGRPIVCPCQLTPEKMIELIDAALGIEASQGPWTDRKREDDIRFYQLKAMRDFIKRYQSDEQYRPWWDSFFFGFCASAMGIIILRAIFHV